MIKSLTGYGRAVKTLNGREFTVEAGLESAVLYVCGIGYQTVSLNGEAVDSAALDPAHTDYTKTCQ